MLAENFCHLWPNELFKPIMGINPVRDAPLIKSDDRYPSLMKPLCCLSQFYTIVLHSCCRSLPRILLVSAEMA
jgi:hypothetical protein